MCLKLCSKISTVIMAVEQLSYNKEIGYLPHGDDFDEHI